MLDAGLAISEEAKTAFSVKMKHISGHLEMAILVHAG